MRSGRFQLLVQLVFSILAYVSEHNVIMLDGAALEHLYLRLFGYRSTIDSLFHFERDGFFKFVKCHVNDVKVTRLQQLEQESLFLAILVIPEFAFHIERQGIPWTQNGM